MKLLSLTVLLFISACSPINVQTAKYLSKDQNGSIIYYFDGYTDPGETEPGSGRPYMERQLEKKCPQGFRINSYFDFPEHNAFSEFLYWNGQGQCSPTAWGKTKDQ